MNSGLNMNRHRKKQRIRASYIWAVVMTICAVTALFAAVWVVIAVYEKIAGDSSEWVLESPIEETIELEIEQEEVYGWITDENGSRYREEDGLFAADAWKIWNDQLYYLKEDGYMATDYVKKDGQIFYFESDGALKDIQLDSDWQGLTGEDNLQNLDSLVKSYEFWGYLSSDDSYTGLLKPICYRKTTETKEQFLGGSENPELSTKNSLQIHDGYLYYLPQVTPQAYGSLSQTEQSICNKLFRMKPGEREKELLAEGATGYLILEDNTIYYASNGEIKKAAGGTLYSIGDEQYHVQVNGNGCYLTDSMGNVVTGDQMVGNRMYHLDESGRITDISLGEQRIGNLIFTLEADTQNIGVKALYKQEEGGQKIIVARALLGINSFCIAEGKLYYSAQVATGEDGTRYSEIYQMEPDGLEAKKISERFPGNFLNLYYYPGQQKIYGEYAPVSWKSCYGQIAEISLDGVINVIDDSASRGNSDQDSNELLTLLMVDGNTVITYLRTCEYDANNKTWKVLSERPYQFLTIIKEKIGEDESIKASEGEENPQSAETGASRPSSSQTETTKPSSSRTETTESSSRTETTRPSSSQAETTRPSSSQAETTRPSSSQAETTRPSSSQAETTRPSSSQAETTRPSSQTEAARPSSTETRTVPTTEAVRPAEPIQSEVSRPEESAAPGPGNMDEIPTIEANPESNLNQGPGNDSDSVRFIGPGGN